MPEKSRFDPDCQKCPRLHQLLGEVKDKFPNYHAKPVAPFGDPAARLLVVGLAPGMHGANATGRPFTGDYAGLLLYQALFESGFSNQLQSTALSDGLQNLTESLLAARFIAPGVYIVMHGQVFPVSKVHKDKDKATFVRT